MAGTGELGEDGQRNNVRVKNCGERQSGYLSVAVVQMDHQCGEDYTRRNLAWKILASQPAQFSEGHWPPAIFDVLSKLSGMEIIV
jgi:hypothetical protein